jgi:Ca-activated chloride channel family protein
MIFDFSTPSYLFLLLIIPLLIFIHIYSLKASRQNAIKFANFEAIARISGVDLYSKNILILFLSSILVFLLVFSLAGASVSLTRQSSALSYVIALDNSRSMEANDFQPTRLESAKSLSKSFLNSLPLGTRVGLISFSGQAFIEQSITEDKNSLISSIDGINVSYVGGTDVNEAIIVGVNLLDGEEGGSLILLSDGQINTGSTQEAIDYALKRNVIVHTIAIGTIAGGNTTYGFSKLDEESLKAISYNTNGKFFNVKSESELSSSFAEIVNLKERLVKIELAPYFLSSTLVIFICIYFLANTRFRIFP